MGKHASPRKMITLPEELEKAVGNLAKDERRAWSQMAVVLLIEALESRGIKIDE
ncbi:MAG: hypothetical protein WBF90_32210 [Rivularia sp. (in: cyanobacteria)]